jgi:hypothetical protein
MISVDISFKEEYKWPRDILKILNVTDHQGNANEKHSEI